MEQISDKTERLKGGIKKIITLQQELKAEAMRLRAENQKLTEQISRQTEELRKLGEDYKTLKLAKALQDAPGGVNQAELKQKIQEMVRDIDKCLVLLNR